MKLRRLYIIDRKTSDLVYKRTFAITESLYNSEKHCKIPADTDSIIGAFMERFTVDNELTINFKPNRDSCDRHDWYPILSLAVDSYTIWPVVYITTAKYILIGIPLIDLKKKDVSLLHCPEITSAVELLDTISMFLKDLSQQLASEPPQFEIEDILNFVTPYGELTNSSIANFILGVSGDANLSLSSRDQLQSNTKQNATVTISIKEVVKGVIYNKQRINDYFDYTGRIVLSSTLPVKTDVSLNLISTQDLTHMVPSPVLGSFEKSDSTSSVTDNSLQLFLTPGSDTVEIIKYKFDPTHPPITGYYKVTNTKPGLQFNLQLQFYLEDKLIFDYIEVTLPFPNRGPITSLDPQNSEVSLNRSRNQILWRKNKPSVTDKMSLTGNIQFDTRLASPDNHPVLQDTNAYVDVTFRCSSTTLSGMRLLSEAVVVFPAAKFRLNHDVLSTGSSIRIWNSSGEVLEQ